VDVKQDEQKPLVSGQSTTTAERGGSRPAPGKVTLTSKLSGGQGSAVQRKAAESSAGSAPGSRPSGAPANDTWMDMAHRGMTALDAEAGMASAPANGAPQTEDALLAAIQSGDPSSVDVSQLVGGQPLDAEVREQLEAKFAFDLGAVRIYTDPVAASVVERLGALAFSYKNHIAFAGGAYQPGSAQGRALIAHELAHYVQTGGAQGQAADQAAPLGDAGGAHEAEADRVAQHAAGDVQLKERLPGVQQAQASSGALGQRPAAGYEIRERAGAERSHRCIPGCSSPSTSTPTHTPPSIALTEDAMGQSNVDQMNDLHDGTKNVRSDTSGVWYSPEYDAHMKRQGKTMDPSWWQGHAPPAYFDKKSGNKQFRLKDGVSAAEGVEAFFRGLTVAECFSVMVAMNYRTILRAIGSQKFDAAFGEKGGTKPETKRMFIQMGLGSNNPLHTYMKETDAAKSGSEGSAGKRPAKKGEWYYFYNHPHYLLKHPGGSYQGENAFCMGTNSKGEQIWRGFGVPQVTEEEMLQKMFAAYNADRTERDKQVIASSGNPDQYDWTKGGFKEKLGDWKEILTAPAATVDGASRKGGFVVGAGQVLDVNEVKKL
jgi:hypothetical protein